MKKSISAWKFALGIIIWTSILNFIVGIPIKHWENTLTPNFLIAFTLGTTLLCIFLSVYYGFRRYDLKGSPLNVALWTAGLIFGITAVMTLAFAQLIGTIFGTSLTTSSLISSISTWVIYALVYGMATFIALKVFYRPTLGVRPI